MGPVGATEVVCFIIAISLNALCYGAHALPTRWRACGCPKKLLYVSNRASNADVENRESYFALSSMDARHLTTSHFLPRPYLLALRILELAFFVIVVACDGTTGDKFGTEFPWPAFFTSWCFVAFGAWALVGVVVTANDMRTDARTCAQVEQQEMEAEGKAAKNEEDWKLRRGGSSNEEGGAAAAPVAAGCSSAPATPQRGAGSSPRVEGSSDDLEAADSKKKTTAKKPSVPSPASSTVSSCNSADSRRPLTAPPPKTAAATDSKKHPRRPPQQQQQQQQQQQLSLLLPPQPMDLPHNLYSLLSSVAGPAAIFVALLYWLVLRRFIEKAERESGKKFDPVDAMLHGGNALFVILDILLSRVPAASSHFQVTLAFGTCYSVFIWSYERLTGGKLLYGMILAWSRPTAVAFYGFALPGSLLACFVFWCLLAAGREALGGRRITKKKQEAGGEAGAAAAETEEDEEAAKKERERKGDEEERRTKERTQRWTDENYCASLPSLSTATTTANEPASLV